MEGLQLGWLQWFPTLLLVHTAVWNMPMLIMPTAFWATVYNLFYAAFQLLIVWFAYRQTMTLERLRNEGESLGDYLQQLHGQRLFTIDDADNGEEKQQKFAFSDEFYRLFKQEQIYLNNELSIDSLAKRLGTNRNYLSKFINSEIKQTFYDYVNQWRVSHAAQLLTTTTLSVDAVAVKSGFKSGSTFFRQFRKITGLTPLAYRKQGGE